MKKIVLLSVIMNSISPQVWAMDENEKGSKSPLPPRKALVSEVPDNPEQRPPSNPQEGAISVEEAVQNFALKNRRGLPYDWLKEQIFLSLRTIESPKERLAAVACLEAICPKIRNLKVEDMSKILSKLKAIQSPDQRLATMTFLQETAPNLSHVVVESLGELIYRLKEIQSLDEYSASISCLEAIASKVRHLSTNDLRDILLDVKRIEDLEHRLDIMTFLQDIMTFLQDICHNGPKTSLDGIMDMIQLLDYISNKDQRQSILASALAIFQKKPDLWSEPPIRKYRSACRLSDILSKLVQMKDSTHRHLATAFVQELISKTPDILGVDVNEIIDELMMGSKADKIHQAIDFFGDFWHILPNLPGISVGPLIRELNLIEGEPQKQIALEFTRHFCGTSDKTIEFDRRRTSKTNCPGFCSRANHNRT